MALGELDLLAQKVEFSMAITDETTRKNYISKLRSLALALETPAESIQRIIYLGIQPSICRVGNDLHLFEILVKNNRPMTTEKLAEETNCDPVLLSRLLRFLASTDMITETEANTFTASNITKALAKPSFIAGMNFTFDCMSPIYQAYPEFLKSTNYKNPTAHSAPWMFAHKTELPIFPWLQEHPEKLKMFMAWMKAQRDGMATWLDAYPMAEVVGNFDPERVLFVDVGGGMGHQCAALKARYPMIPGRVVLEDQAVTLKGALVTGGVETVEQNFFETQKIKNAKFYYLRNILHDWQDTDCITILTNLRKAMAPDSLILIDEMVLPNSNTHFQAMNIDITMMGISALERTHDQWVTLLDQAGLKVEETFVYTRVLGDSVLACVGK